MYYRIQGVRQSGGSTPLAIVTASISGDRAVNVGVSAKTWRIWRHFDVTIFLFLWYLPLTQAEDNVGASIHTPWNLERKYKELCRVYSGFVWLYFCKIQEAGTTYSTLLHQSNCTWEKQLWLWKKHDEFWYKAY